LTRRRVVTAVRIIMMVMRMSGPAGRCICVRQAAMVVVIVRIRRRRGRRSGAVGQRPRRGHRGRRGGGRRGEGSHRRAAGDGPSSLDIRSWSEERLRWLFVIMPTRKGQRIQEILFGNPENVPKTPPNSRRWGRDAIVSTRLRSRSGRGFLYSSSNSLLDGEEGRYLAPDMIRVGWNWTGYAHPTPTPTRCALIPVS
jgi:hypothetical protein